jgi:hypothetical protein
LRQGGPLSSLLFVIVMEMKALGTTAMSGGLLSGSFVGTRIDITHLLFANDTLIFCGVDPDYLRHPRCLFLGFEVKLG